MTDKLLNIDELAGSLGGIGGASIYRHIKSLSGFPQPVRCSRGDNSADMASRS